MSMVIIPKREYQKLLERALRYDYLQEIMKEDLFTPPPTRNVKEIIKRFSKTGFTRRNSLKVWKKD